MFVFCNPTPAPTIMSVPVIAAPKLFKLETASKPNSVTVLLNGFSISGNFSNDKGATSIKDLMASITGLA